MENMLRFEIPTLNFRTKSRLNCRVLMITQKVYILTLKMVRIHGFVALGGPFGERKYLGTLCLAKSEEVCILA
jgi:hypothetical protein